MALKTTFRVALPRAPRTDVLVHFIHSDRSRFSKEMNAARSIGRSGLRSLMVTGDFAGKAGETAILHTGAAGCPRLLLVGLGPYAKVSLERYRRAAAIAAKEARRRKASTAGFVLPALRGSAEDAVVAFAEGAHLGLYRFDKYKKPDDDGMPLEEIFLVSASSALRAPALRALRRAEAIVAGTILARDLANAPGNEVYPESLAQAALEAGRRSGFDVRILGEAELSELGMGGVLAVNRGSDREPRFIIMEYGPTTKRPVVLVGKGVTFDTGGISIKPSAGMAEMKMDMSGAAAVIGTFETVARLRLPVRLVGLVPAVENMPGSSAQRPGDIIRHLNGKTSEVDNTDAEGRLILADALAYAERYKPAAVIDLATLTGAVVVALGHVVTGMMGNDPELMRRLQTAGETTYERVWELPLFDEYERLIKSDVADVKNVGGRWAGAITAGWFLKKHIGNYRWVHLDIAGTAIQEENSDYTTRGGSGVGVRLLTEFLRRWR
ncbi:MAG: leucyl aminopeptidase [Bacteroidetes bacterium]|jgi:leucyl aminopeptidase|nr:leucyl aminopeptidase [Bacteroidota bacterium]